MIYKYNFLKSTKLEVEQTCKFIQFFFSCLDIFAIISHNTNIPLEGSPINMIKVVEEEKFYSSLLVLKSKSINPESTLAETPRTLSSPE